jgi:hypothetical protein
VNDPGATDAGEAPTDLPESGEASDEPSNGAEPLVGEGGGDTPVDEEAAAAGQLSYDCAAWAGETRGLLRSLLLSEDIPHVWQGTTVTVREADEEVVDRLVDEVAGSARPALDPAAEKVVYEVGAWPVALLTQLADDLTLADIAYEWDERGDLVVLESDEEQVGIILDALPDPDESAISSDDGVAVHGVLDSVFMASDRLARNGGDAGGTVGLVEAAEVLGQLALPFGFEPGQWRSLVAAVTGLQDLLEADATDDEVSSSARSVRELVRQYI